MDVVSKLVRILKPFFGSKWNTQFVVVSWGKILVPVFVQRRIVGLVGGCSVDLKFMPLFLVDT